MAMTFITHFLPLSYLLGDKNPFSQSKPKMTCESVILRTRTPLIFCRFFCKGKWAKRSPLGVSVSRRSFSMESVCSFSLYRLGGLRMHSLRSLATDTTPNNASSLFAITHTITSPQSAIVHIHSTLIGSGLYQGQYRQHKRSQSQQMGKNCSANFHYPRQNGAKMEASSW